MCPGARRVPALSSARGRELGTRPVTATGKLTDSKVAAYVAKAATKAAECTGTVDRRITPADQLDALPVREHARSHIAECIRLSKLPSLEDLRLAAWAHTLGFSSPGWSYPVQISTAPVAARVSARPALTFRFSAPGIPAVTPVPRGKSGVAAAC